MNAKQNSKKALNKMSKKWDYTSSARKFTARFPVLSYLGIQINFWIIANVFLCVLLHLQLLSISETYQIHRPGGLGTTLILAVLFGFLYGVILGLTDHYLDKNLKERQSMGRIILIKSILSLVLIVSMLVFTKRIFFNLFVDPSLYAPSFMVKDKSWEYMFFILVIYYFFMTFIIGFINQVNRKYGPGVLVPLLLGKYKTPKEEERIFMFMDLKSSTAIAEKLGHFKYSSFIRDSFLDINKILLSFNADVYQYVGDEIVVTWRLADGERDLSCIRFFFGCEKQFQDNANYYLTNYGILPQFKAGLHLGKVTAVEIGDIKRDIAYHGDTLNTASRIQSVCNDYHKKFLISAHALNSLDQHQQLKTEAIGDILLRGKSVKVGIFSVEGIESYTC
ncbi:adenylate/guanylate cyclase domain-containing protein [Pedobacter gandavensis]|uniref:adenylate/guanylate cyclase domain-containing protein n=1 Tax=Pedobacter gandavensis TaxID=2679963 RepID=UPI0024790FEB|nr:adenylate/guanylate cyclase domain-containing protein [Pedobacter gandavensis]WGQ10539.1 adenylate/guanylate cyclase domain-containing protein [Pedobacter gandavensis]